MWFYFFFFLTGEFPVPLFPFLELSDSIHTVRRSSIARWLALLVFLPTDPSVGGTHGVQFSVIGLLSHTGGVRPGEGRTRPQPYFQFSSSRELALPVFWAPG